MRHDSRKYGQSFVPLQLLSEREDDRDGHMCAMNFLKITWHSGAAQVHEGEVHTAHHIPKGQDDRASGRIGNFCCRRLRRYSGMHAARACSLTIFCQSIVNPGTLVPTAAAHAWSLRNN